MRKLYSILFVTLLSVSLLTGSAFGWGSSGGDGSLYGALQETAVFYNNSGGVVSAGDVVILDLTGTGVASGSTLGGYVTTTTTADVKYAVGVVKTRSSPDQTPVVVVTRGPVQAYGTDSAVSPKAGDIVGTWTTAGMFDNGTELGYRLADAGGNDKTEPTLVKSWIWVQLGVD